MQQISKEILGSYQQRKSKKDKDRFIELMQKNFPQLQIEQGGLFKSRNLVIGDVEKAKIILSAHYDTCARLPFPNFVAPKNFLASILYSLAIVLPLFVIIILANALLAFLGLGGGFSLFVSLLLYFGFMAMLFFGPANKNNANDNSSGVICLLELMHSMSRQQLDKVAFVFFDHEEMGLLGSAWFRKRHKKQLADKLIINLDCVSDGDDILLVLNPAAMKKHRAGMENAFVPNDKKQLHIESSRKAMYPSDQIGFPCSAAIAAMRKKPLIGLYLTDIHTSRDRVFDRENIGYICQGISNFVENFN